MAENVQRSLRKWSEVWRIRRKYQAVSGQAKAELGPVLKSFRRVQCLVSLVREQGQDYLFLSLKYGPRVRFLYALFNTFEADDMLFDIGLSPTEQKMLVKNVAHAQAIWQNETRFDACSECGGTGRVEELVRPLFHDGDDIVVFSTKPCPKCGQNQCRTCYGTGVITNYSARWDEPDDTVDCPDCVEESRCPRCAGNLTRTANYDGICAECGWKTS